MAFYENQSWPVAQARQPSWEQQLPPQRSADSPAPTSEPSLAFTTQLEEVERAIDNLSKSGKAYQGGPGPYAANTRRESFPVPGRGYSDMGSMPSARFGQDRANQMPNPRSSAMGRYPPVTEFDGGRPGSTVGMTGYGVPPRFAPAQNDQEQALQAKRRLAAQRERELRNYHQEQQYSRGTPGLPTDRPQSPASANNSDDHRDLMARQHRALYGQEASIYAADMAGQRPQHDARASISGVSRGASPLAFDTFGKISDSAVHMPSRDNGVPIADRRPSVSPPSAARLSFGIEAPTSPSGNSAISPVGSPALGPGPMASLSSGIISISNRQTSAKHSNERSTSAASQGVTEKTPTLGGWGGNSGVWGAVPKNTLGVQASVWG